MPPVRSRNRGKRFQGPGWRDPCGGSLYFQLKRSALNFSRYHEVSPSRTMDQLLDDLENDVLGDDGYPEMGDELHFEFFLRKQPLQPGPEKAFRTFNGGETVYVKVMDDEGKEYVPSYGGEYNYERKVRGKKPKLEDIMREYGPRLGEVEAYRLGLL